MYHCFQAFMFCFVTEDFRKKIHLSIRTYNSLIRMKLRKICWFFSKTNKKQQLKNSCLSLLVKKSHLYISFTESLLWWWVVCSSATCLFRFRCSPWPLDVTWVLIWWKKAIFSSNPSYTTSQTSSQTHLLLNRTWSYL